MPSPSKRALSRGMATSAQEAAALPTGGVLEGLNKYRRGHFRVLPASVRVIPAEPPIALEDRPEPVPSLVDDAAMQRYDAGVAPAPTQSADAEMASPGRAPAPPPSEEQLAALDLSGLRHMCTARGIPHVGIRRKVDLRALLLQQGAR